uniref:Origin recognition complex subunit 1 n=1 Tax=Graphocephala atropunctata TaxID=36148 RepID=A0A1B6LMD1_9HEMI
MNNPKLRETDIQSQLNDNSSSDSDATDSDATDSDCEPVQTTRKSVRSKKIATSLKTTYKNESNVKQGKKRKAQNNDPGVKPSKIACSSPSTSLKTVFKSKDLAKEKLLTPRSKQEKSSLSHISMSETSQSKTPSKYDSKLLDSGLEVCSPGTQKNKTKTSALKKYPEKLDTVENDLWHIKNIDSPKRLSAKKNLFSPEKYAANLGTLRVCLSRLPRTKIEPNESESFLNEELKSSTKCVASSNSYTPNKSGKENVWDSPVKGENRTPLKEKESLDDLDLGFRDIKLLNESSPSKKIPANTDISSPCSQKSTISLPKISPLKTSKDTLPKKLNLRTKTPQKGTNNSPLKSLSVNLKLVHDLSPSNKFQVTSKISRRRSSGTSSDSGESDSVRSMRRTSRKEQPIPEEDNENKKENDGISSDDEYSTPAKKENRIQSESKRTPLSVSKYNEVLKPKVLTPLRKRDITVTTPVSKKKSGRGFLTPSMAKKEHVSDERFEDALDKTRKQLHISTIPKSLPCRDSEFAQVKSFLLRKIEHAAGGCMYISGVPGTGKTATVHAVIRTLQQEVSEEEIPQFDFVEVNGLRLTEPRQAYVRIYQALTDQKVTPDQAQQLLNKRFSGKCKKSTIILVDELDYLCNRRQDVVYNILDWPTKRSSALVVLTISNTMDLPERTLKGRVTSRMGLTRLVFQPYSHHQLREIVQDRLCGSSTFHPDAVQLVARKVAAVSGDARRALDICRRTTELVGGSGEQVTVCHVERALTQIFSGPRVVTIQSLSGLGRLVLRSLRDVNQRTGVDEASVAQVYHHLQQICVLEAAILPPVGAVLQTCVTLAGVGLMMAEKGRMDLTRKVILNVSSDDIHYALDNLES